MRIAGKTSESELLEELLLLLFSGEMTLHVIFDVLVKIYVLEDKGARVVAQGLILNRT